MINFNGNNIIDIKFNGNTINSAMFNNTQVFSSAKYYYNTTNDLTFTGFLSYNIPEKIVQGESGTITCEQLSSYGPQGAIIIKVNGVRIGTVTVSYVGAIKSFPFTPTADYSVSTELETAIP